MPVFNFELRQLLGASRREAQESCPGPNIALQRAV